MSYFALPSETHWQRLYFFISRDFFKAKVGGFVLIVLHKLLHPKGAKTRQIL